MFIVWFKCILYLVKIMNTTTSLMRNCSRYFLEFRNPFCKSINGHFNEKVATDGALKVY